MSTRGKKYSLDDVKKDLKAFFLDNGHKAYKYGDKSKFCNIDSAFYKKQIQIIFEDDYPHDVVGKGVNELISERFLRPEPRTFGNNVGIIFVCRRNIRYIATEIKERIKLIETLSDDELNLGVGKHAENLFAHMFEKNQFKIIGVNTNQFRGKKWHTKSNLDFIIQKDKIVYGVEVKNTFDYMPEDEFEEKLDMCELLNIIPMFSLRCPSAQQYALMQAHEGLALKFKTRIFPPGNEKFVSSIWHYFRLPVNVWGSIPINIERIFLRFHSTNTP